MGFYRKCDFTGKSWRYTGPCQMRDNFSLVVLPLLLHLLPLLVTAISWRLERGVSPALSKCRRVLFHAGVLLSLLSLLLTASCWIDAYPLVQHADGSSSIPGLELAWTAAFITAIMTTLFALAGKGPGKDRTGSQRWANSSSRIWNIASERDLKANSSWCSPKTVRVQPVAATPSDSPGIPALRPDQNSWTLADISVLISLEGQPSF
jgi:hypothetical protein